MAMRIAFYAPMKPPDDPVPSGDREMARGLIRALERGGNAVEIASRFRSREPAGDAATQRALAAEGEALADAFVSDRSKNAKTAPDLWMTYHLYYKAPDWIGPHVAEALDIPYVVAEASHAPKRADGPWDTSHRAVELALGIAAAAIGLNRHDSACVRPVLASPDRLHEMPPFTDIDPFAAAAQERETHRAELAQRTGIDPETPILLAVGMMRSGDKQASYQVLARALERIRDRDWQLVVVGDGQARLEVEQAFAAVDPERMHWIGEMDRSELPAVYAAADLLVWPAVNEAYGMAILEAQAAGLPVVAGRTGGVPDIVADGETGVLVPPDDDRAIAEAVGAVLDNSARRQLMAAAAIERTSSQHSLDAAAGRLNDILTPLVEKSAA